MVSFPHAIKLAFSQYSKFDGRATRAEYWWFQLFFYPCYIFLIIPFVILSNYISIIAYAVFIPLLIPQVTVTTRRLHDISQSGWVQVIQYIPCVNIVGFFVIIYLCCKNSTTGSNYYGPDPRGDLQVDGSYRSEASYFDETLVEKSSDDSRSDEKQCRICYVSNQPNSKFCKQCGGPLDNAT